MQTSFARISGRDDEWSWKRRGDTLHLVQVFAQGVEPEFKQVRWSAHPESASQLERRCNYTNGERRCALGFLDAAYRSLGRHHGPESDESKVSRANTNRDPTPEGLAARGQLMRKTLALSVAGDVNPL